VTIGDALAAGRREAGMTVTAVSQRTCIRETIIRGIERDDFSGCGGDFYARGHIRSIAGVVGIDPGPLIVEYDRTVGAPMAISAADVFQPVTPVRLRERRKPNWTGALALALLATAGVFAYVHFNAHTATVSNTKRQVQTANTHRPSASRQPAVAPHKARKLDIKLTAKQNCWVALTVLRTGRQIFSGVIYAGHSMQWSEGRSVRLQIGNPAGVVLTVNGSANMIHKGTTHPVNLNLTIRQPRNSAKHAG
jgi:cytoskeletal protein RodZ